MLLAVLAGSSLGVGVLAGVAALAPSASAATTTTSEMDPPPPPPSGKAQVEVCKAFTTPTINESTTPAFVYKVTDSTKATTTVTVTAGAGAGNFVCSDPITVAPGAVTITEVGALNGGSQQWYQVSSINEPSGDGYITQTNLATGTVTVDVAANNSATVQYTNDPVYGYVEVCKSAPSGSTLSGTFTYDLTGENGYTGTATTQVGSCSGPVQVPAGDLTATEAGTNLYVTSIQAAYNAGAPGNVPIVGSPNLQTGTVEVNVMPSASSSSQTDIYYSDDVVQFKVCKAWTGGDEPGGASTMFPFSLSSSGVAGPISVPATLDLAAGSCSNPVPLRAGTVVTVVEGIVPGTKVASITASGAYGMPATSPFPNGNPDVLNGRVQVIVGQPTTGSPTASVNEAVVTFTDQAADPSSLKLCVFAGSPAPSKSSYSFTVSGGPSTPTVVPVNGCQVVGGAGYTFPFNSTVAISGKGSVSPDVATNIAVSPQFVEVMTPSGPADTIEPVIVPGSLDLANPSVSVQMSEGGTAVTEVDFTVASAPSKTTTSGTTSTTQSSTIGGASGGASGGSGSDPSSGASASSGGSASIPTTSVSSAPTTTPTGTGGSSTGTGTGTGTSTGTGTGSSSAAGPAVTSKATSALLVEDTAHLRLVDGSIASTIKALGHYHSAWHNAAQHHSKKAPLLLKDVQRLHQRLASLYKLRHQLLAALASL